MAGRFVISSFSEINIEDSFFESLKRDYPGNENSTGFVEWFQKKKQEKAKALTFEDEQGLGAFIYTKSEQEEIKLANSLLPSIYRMKIGTFRIDERYQGQRIGEGALGLVLWEWQQTDYKEIYVTVFEKQAPLISLFERFGFEIVGNNANNEKVLIKRRTIISGDPVKSFPFIDSGFDYAGYLIVEDNYHDNMFAYSELANTKFLQSQVIKSVSNGIRKIYIGKIRAEKYYIGEPVFIYRKHTKEGVKRYKSCVTSYCVVTNIINIKRNNRYDCSWQEFIAMVGNKSVFSENELLIMYETYNNLSAIELLYCGYFGAGNNVNMDWLDQNGCWVTTENYPADIRLSYDQFYDILKKGEIYVPNVIIN